MSEKKEKNVLTRQILLLITHLIVFSSFRNKKSKNKKKNGWFNFHFFSKPDKNKPNKDKSLQNIKSDDPHLETINIIDSLTEEIDKKKRKDGENFVDFHLETVKRVDSLMEKMEKRKEDKKQGFFEKFNFYSSNVLKWGDSLEGESISPEFLSVSPFQMEGIGKQWSEKNPNLTNNNNIGFFDKNNVSKIKMKQCEKEVMAPTVEDFSKIEIKESYDSPVISETEVKDKEKTFKTSEGKKESKWISTGILGFDELLEEGIPTGSNIIVAGGPGCGKTIFSLQALYNKASEGKDCVFLSMEERPEKLKEHMLEFGFNVEEIEKSEEQIILRVNGKGRMSLKRLQPIRLARSIEALLEKASGTLPVDIDLVLDFIPEDFDACLLTLDSISAIETAFSGTRRQYRIYIEQLFRYFEHMNLTTFMITESSDVPHKFSNTGVEEFLADGIFVFYNFQGAKKRKRATEIFKLRGASHSQRIVPMKITSNGMKIFPDESYKE